MTRIAKSDWDQVHELACDIANASAQDDEVLSDSRTSALIDCLAELEKKYGPCSRITATKADYAEGKSERTALYAEALMQARAEGDSENEALILESLQEIRNET